MLISVLFLNFDIILYKGIFKVIFLKGDEIQSLHVNYRYL